MNVLSTKNNIIRVLMIIAVLILGSISLFGYYSMYTMFKTYGGTHLLKIITTAIELGCFLSAYFVVRKFLKLPSKISTLNKVKIIFTAILIGSGYLAFKPFQMPLFMIFSFALPVIVVIYLISDAIYFFKKNKNILNSNNVEEKI